MAAATPSAVARTRAALALVGGAAMDTAGIMGTQHNMDKAVMDVKHKLDKAVMDVTVSAWTS